MGVVYWGVKNASFLVVWGERVCKKRSYYGTMGVGERGWCKHINDDGIWGVWGECKNTP